MTCIPNEGYSFSALAKKVPFIFCIDEFQDINLIQWKIMCMLAAPENNLFVVGATTVSIYRASVGSKRKLRLDCRKI